MLALDMSALYFRSSRFQETFLVAHFEEPERFLPGEYTSDVLGYFGFGMGSYRMPEGSPPLWSKGLEFFQFQDIRPALDAPHADKLKIFTATVSRLHQLLQWYAGRGIYFNLYDVRTFMNLAAAYIGGHVTPYMMDVVAIIPESPKHPVSEGVTFMEIRSDGEVCLGFGGPETEGTPPDVTQFYLRDSDARFDWHHSSQLGTPENALSIIRSLKNLKYSTKSEEARKSELNFLFNHLNHIKGAV